MALQVSVAWEQFSAPAQQALAFAAAAQGADSRSGIGSLGTEGLLLGIIGPLGISGSDEATTLLAHFGLDRGRLSGLLPKVGLSSPIGAFPPQPVPLSDMPGPLTENASKAIESASMLSSEFPSSDQLI